MAAWPVGGRRGLRDLLLGNSQLHCDEVSSCAQLTSFFKGGGVTLALALPCHAPFSASTFVFPSSSPVLQFSAFYGRDASLGLVSDVATLLL